MSTENQNNTDGNNVGNSLLTTILILVFITQIGAMSWYTYRSMHEALQAQTLVAEAEAAIEKNYPQVREDVVEYLDENAPAIAERISQQAIDSTPEVRSWLEEMTARQMRYGLDEVTEMSAESFRDFVQNNRADIEVAFAQIEQAPEETRELMLTLEQQMDQQFGVELESQARNALEVHRKLNRKLETLSSEVRLEPKQLLERRIVRLLRTFQEQKLPESAELGLPIISKND